MAKTITKQGKRTKTLTKPIIKKTSAKPVIAKPAVKLSGKKFAAKQALAKSQVKTAAKKQLAKPVFAKQTAKTGTVKGTSGKMIVKPAIKPGIKKPIVKKIINKNSIKPVVKKTAGKPVTKVIAKKAAVKAPAKPIAKPVAKKHMITKPMPKKAAIKSPIKQLAKSVAKKPIFTKPIQKKATIKSPIKPVAKIAPQKATAAKPAPKPVAIKPQAKKATQPPVKKTPVKPIPKPSASKPLPKKEVEKPEIKPEVVIKPASTIDAIKPLEPRGNYPKIVEKRFIQIYSQMDDLKLDAVVVTHLPNVRYLTNFSGSAGALFILKDSMHFVTDDRYEEQIKDELYPLPNLSTYISRDPWNTSVDKKFLKGVVNMGFEADRMAYSEAVYNRNTLRPVKFKPEDQLVERYTMPKGAEELENIQKACDLAEKVYQKILKVIKPGVTEIDIAIEIAYQSRKMGSERDPFDIIVVSGPRGSLIHGKPSTKQIKKNDIVILDFGCVVNGFCTDITRTISVGNPTMEQKDIYKLLIDAQKAAIDFVRPGMNGKNLDKAARSLIEKAGYGKFFQHSLGHGIGIEVHESPTITFRKEDQIVPEDVVLAIEPGIYLPGKFGMRVEDIITVTRTGGRNLTNSPKELVVI